MMNPDELLNGSAAVPLYSDTAPVAQRPADAGRGANGVSSSPQQVLIAWIVLASILVLANVVTFDSKPGERHVHFSVIESTWMLAFLVVVLNLAKYLLGRYHVPGVSELVGNV